ncbi:MAG: sigma-54-dependent transcriptional regulator [Chitinispirillaceae bacterium]
MSETTDSKSIWIVEDDRALGTMLVEEVGDAGFEAEWIPSAEKALHALGKMQPDLVVSDLRLPGMDGLSFMRMVHQMLPDSPPAFLIITAFGTIPKAIEALRAGADDFLTKPLDLEHFMLAVERTFEKRQLKRMVSHMRQLSSEGFHKMYGKCDSMRRLFDQIRQLASSRGTVLITGESGTGKELVARAIHEESERSDGPFVPVNCAGIPEHLLESEFFGHVEGSFTGARKGRQGLFAEARGGTLFLDEISEMPLSLQAKLLRILQDKKVRRIGENREYQVDVRILAATHRDIEQEVKDGRFRKDLFFRLETFTLQVPPLRERGEDIEMLAAVFMREFALSLGKKIKGFSQSALECISAYTFPGNIRELRNAMERAVTFCDSNRIQLENLPARMRNHGSVSGQSASVVDTLLNRKNEFLPLEEIERRYIKRVLEYVGGNKKQAAAILGIGRRTLYRKFESDLHSDAANL